jgi:hypothetical protein
LNIRHCDLPALLNNELIHSGIYSQYYIHINNGNTMSLII